MQFLSVLCRARVIKVPSLHVDSDLNYKRASQTLVSVPRQWCPYVIQVIVQFTVWRLVFFFYQILVFRGRICFECSLILRKYSGVSVIVQSYHVTWSWHYNHYEETDLFEEWLLYPVQARCLIISGNGWDKWRSFWIIVVGDRHGKANELFEADRAWHTEWRRNKNISVFGGWKTP